MKKWGHWLIYSAVLVLTALLGASPALAAGKVIVYSSNQQQQNDIMAAAFEKATGVKCEMVRAGSGVLVKRMKAEKNRPLGDVALGLSNIILENNMDLWEPYKIKDFAAYPAEYKDPNGMWVGKILHVMVFMYNTKLISAAQAPKAWSDFLDPQWQDKVAFCNPNNAGSAYSQLSIMLSLWGDNEAGWKKAEKFLKQAKITQQSSIVYTGVASGEFPAGITLEYAAYRLKKDGAPVEVVYPAEGTLAYTEGLAIIKGAPNRENARKFMDWATSVETRKQILDQFLRRPSRPDIDFTGLAPGMIPMSKINLLKNYDDNYWTKRRPEILEKVKDILLRVK
ncbi:MAG: extracellular solute-binding protein [Deltaproteobacteria bacterium]|nr:extracellular solute-binding protein [Deltaproteobacteria bacterium]